MDTWIGLPVYVGAPVSQLSFGMTRNQRDRAYYEAVRARIPLSPPGWLFGIAWSILYPIIGVVSFLYWRWYAESALYTATLTLHWINFFLNITWQPTFFGSRARGLAAFLSLGILLTSIVVLVLLIATGVTWWMTLLYSLYVAWLLFALYLSFMAFIRPPKRPTR
jgi:tryptophan-rich sensory protein